MYFFQPTGLSFICYIYLEAVFLAKDAGMERLDGYLTYRERE